MAQYPPYQPYPGSNQQASYQRGPPPQPQHNQQYPNHQPPYGQSQSYRPPQPSTGPYPQQPPHEQPHSSYLPPQSTSPYPPQPPYATHPNASHGRPGPPPPGGQEQYGPSEYKEILHSALRDNGLERSIFETSSNLDAIASRAPAKVNQLCARWNVPMSKGSEIVKLALFDIIIYIDNSGSMMFEEDGQRIDALRDILARVAYAATLFDDDGISLRFMNRPSQEYSLPPLDNITNETQITQLIGHGRQGGAIKFQGLTPIGTQLKAQVLEPLVVSRARAGALRKPVLVITITDGQPAGESRDMVRTAIKDTLEELGRIPNLGRKPVSFQFAQVGNDQAARKFLADLDADPLLGGLIDCHSNHENESEEYYRNKGETMTYESWLLKLLLGAIDRNYDEKDESAASRGHPPANQYGAPQSYGQPPGGYGQQPQYGQPPQQGRPPQQGGYPPQGYPSQGSSYPPQQGGYPPQQQGGYPHHQQGGYPQQQQGGYPQQQQGGYPQQQQSGYPQQQQGGYGRPPPGQPGYPPQGGGYPPQQGGGYGAPPPPRY